MIWEVQIIGDAFDLHELTKSLTANELRVHKRDDQYFLEAQKFESFLSYEELESEVNEILKVLTGATHLAIGGRTKLAIANIAQLKPEGGRHIYLSASEMISMRDSIGIEIKQADGTVKKFNPADIVPQLMMLSLTNASVAKALRLLGTGQYSWVNFYRIYEVIEQDVGGISKITSHGWLSKKAIKLFKHTACSPAAVGDLARHGSESTTPPTNPMAIQTARTLIESLLHNWLESQLKSERIL